MELVGKKDFVEDLDPIRGSDKNNSDLDFKAKRFSGESLLKEFFRQRQQQIDKESKIHEIQNAILDVRSELDSDRDIQELNHCLKTLSKVKYRVSES